VKLTILRSNIRTRLALSFVGILIGVLTIYIAAVFFFQYLLLERQIFHDEIQDVETVEGLLYFDNSGTIRLNESYHSHPQSRLLEDRLMEVRNLSGDVLYRSDTLKESSLGGMIFPNEGAGSYNERSTTLGDGTRVLLISHVHPVQGRQVLIRLGYSMAALHDRMERFFALLLLATPIALLTAGCAGYNIARRALRPVEVMAERAAQITASNLHDRLVVENSEDELGQIARVFNHLLERLEQAFAQLQHFTADAAHELRTPLASIRSSGELALQEQRHASSYRDALAAILEETIRLNQTIDGLLLLSRAEAVQPDSARTSFSLVDLIHEILGLLDVLLEERHISVSEEYNQSLIEQVFADRSLIRIAFLNVLHNAVKFSRPQSTLRIAYKQLERNGRAFHQVAIHDSGPGIASGEYLLVFERFFTSTVHQVSNQRGAGLGLSIARLVIERNGGGIFFDDTAVQGARCCIEIPVTLDLISKRRKDI
jgi:signal transduction histidine kinase